MSKPEKENSPLEEAICAAYQAFMNATTEVGYCPETAKACKKLGCYKLCDILWDYTENATDSKMTLTEYLKKRLSK